MTASSDVNAILAARKTTHGEYMDNGRTMQGLKRVLRESPGWENLPDIVKETLDMWCLKMGRIANGNPFVHEHYNDTSGYGELVVQRTVDKVGFKPEYDPELLFPQDLRGRPAALGEPEMALGISVQERVDVLKAVLGPDPYQFLAQIWNIPRDKAKERALGVTYGMEVPDEAPLGIQMRAGQYELLDPRCITGVRKVDGYLTVALGDREFHAVPRNCWSQNEAGQIRVQKDFADEHLIPYVSGTRPPDKASERVPLRKDLPSTADLSGGTLLVTIPDGTSSSGSRRVTIERGRWELSGDYYFIEKADANRWQLPVEEGPLVGRRPTE